MPVSMRKDMILEAYPNVEVETLADYPTNEEWSQELDVLLKQKIGNDAMLYGSRDSFSFWYT